MNRPVRIGILGAAKIAPYAIVAAARDTRLAKVVLVASRDRTRAEEFARAHGIPRIAPSYDALISDPRIDAVYNALPPSLHADLTVSALEAGKAVLCEKPFCLTGAEARRMAEASTRTGMLLMEAIHSRYHPQLLRAQEIVSSGELGVIEKVIARYNYPIPFDAAEFRHIPNMGGGALLDSGVYCLTWCRSFGLGEPKLVSARSTIGAAGVDELTEAQLIYPGGATGEIRCGISGPIQSSFEVIGSRTSLKVRNFIAPQFFPSYIKVGDRKESVTNEATYNFQLRAFVDAIRTGSPPLMTAISSLQQMDLVDAIRDCCLSGHM